MIINGVSSFKYALSLGKMISSIHSALIGCNEPHQNRSVDIFATQFTQCQWFGRNRQKSWQQTHILTQTLPLVIQLTHSTQTTIQRRPYT
mmetsp:Transcript_15157/g.41937  ORF Transcript_15157/g.41937 Transcript_15157/m.41937 type:complete len:90 (-) Transcript_15157:1299-1568(-)